MEAASFSRPSIAACPSHYTGRPERHPVRAEGAATVELRSVCSPLRSTWLSIQQSPGQSLRDEVALSRHASLLSRGPYGGSDLRCTGIEGSSSNNSTDSETRIGFLTSHVALVPSMPPPQQGDCDADSTSSSASPESRNLNLNAQDECSHRTSIDLHRGPTDNLSSSSPSASAQSASAQSPAHPPQLLASPGNGGEAPMASRNAPEQDSSKQLIPPVAASNTISHQFSTPTDSTYTLSFAGATSAAGGAAFDMPHPLSTDSEKQRHKPSRSMANRLAHLRSRRRKSESEGATVQDPSAIEVEGYAIGSQDWYARTFWVFGKWLYREWLKQESLGLENLPLERGAFFMASNHLSHLDCGATFMAAWAGGAKRVYALGARDYFFRSPVKAWFVTTFMNVIPISRRGFSQQEIEVLMRVKETSGPDNPTAILIFPEGTRSTTGELQQFKAGVGMLAEQLDIPVVPVGVKGTLDALPKGKTIPYRHKIRVAFGAPLDFSSYSASIPANSDLSGDESTVQASAAKPTSDSAVDVQRRARREAQKRFADDLRSSVRAMLNGYGQGRKESPPDPDRHSPPIAHRLGGGKWNTIGWLLYWLPMSLCLALAVILAATQVQRVTGASALLLQGGLGGMGRLGMGAGYAAAAGVFNHVQGAGLNVKVLVLLGVVSIAFYVKAFIQWLWPYVVLECRED